MTGSAFLGTLAFAGGAGVTTFFSPCAFPLLPGYIGYYVHQSDESTPGVLSAAAAAGGALLSVGMIGGFALGVGQQLTPLLPLFEPLVGLGLLLFGGALLFGVTPNRSIQLPSRPDSLVGFAGFGAVYAVAAAGCVVPVFFGVISQALTLPHPQAVAVLGGYAVGIAAPLVGVTLLTSVGIDSWRAAGRYTGWVERGAAVVMIAAGVGQLYLSIVVLDVL